MFAFAAAQHHQIHLRVYRRVAGRVLGGLIGSLVLVLAGCASPRLATTVTHFQQWPAHAKGAGYTVTVEPVLQAEVGKIGETFILPELEAQTYAAYVGQHLQAQGLVPAARPEQARMLVNISIQSRKGVVEVREPFFRPALGVGFGGAHWHFGGLWMDPWMWEDRISRRPVQSYTLQVRIADRHSTTQNKGYAPGRAQSQMPVFDGRAEYTGSPVALHKIMPYLIRAVFDGFPGSNGHTHRVVFDRKTGAQLPAR